MQDEIAKDIELNPADRAEHASRIFALSPYDEDPESALTDVLTDLLHWADYFGNDFNMSLKLARMHYDAEKL